MGGTKLMSVIKPTETISYINDKQKFGINIDWDKVRKEFNKLKIPKDTYSPLKADFSKFGYVIDLSDRSRGKTTNKLLLGLVLFKMYGIVLHYIRQNKNFTTPKMIKDLYLTVKDYGYIEKIFGGSYNDIVYYGKRWSLVKRDKDGTIIDTCTEFCTICIGLDEGDALKSSYNAPRGDMIFHDEFITDHYMYNDFIRFCDICKTIIRDRLSPVIFMSANTIEKNSQWFDELCIRKEIDRMGMGDVEYITSDLGTHVYLEILSENVSAARNAVNVRFFGFQNPKLSSVTGRGTWATETYPHIPDGKQEVLQNKVFIKMSEKYVKLKLVDDESIGVIVLVTPATQVYSDSIIMTVEDIKNKNEIYGTGRKTFLEAYWKLYCMNKFYYSRNSEGSFVKAYIELTMSKNREEYR